MLATQDEHPKRTDIRPTRNQVDGRESRESASFPAYRSNNPTLEVGCMNRKDVASFFVLIVFTLVTLSSAQQNQGSKNDSGQGSDVQFSSSTHLVLVPTLVRDKNNQHISGLKKEDFVVNENGKPRKIAFVDEYKTE